MTNEVIIVNKYVASKGKVFDWAEPHYDEEGNEEHLYAHTIYLGENDLISNYIEVKKDG